LAQAKAEVEAKASEAINKLKAIVAHEAEEIIPKLEELMAPMKMMKAKSHFEQTHQFMQ